MNLGYTTGTALIIKTAVIWDVMPHRLVTNSAEGCSLHCLSILVKLGGTIVKQVKIAVKQLRCNV
jgi:hypothetical protein